MCGRITQEQAEIEKMLRIDARDLKRSLKQYNIGIGEFALVSTAQEEVQQFKFGFNTGGKFNFNARAEGFNNKTNELDYQGKLGIHTNPYYNFSESRCLIPVTSFLEGPEVEKLSKPFKISLNYSKVFMLAGLIGTDEKTGENGFSIITCWPNKTIKETIGHHRCPVILDNPDTWQDWLDPRSSVEDMLTLLRPPNDEDLEIIELSPSYKSAKYDIPY